MNDSLDDRDLRHRRQTWDGFSDALARGVELVATPLIFGLGGWYLDRRAGTRPLFTLLLFLMAIVGMAARMYYAYMADMQEHDRASVWARRPAPPAPAVESGDTAPAVESGDTAPAAESGDTAPAAESGDTASAAESGDTASAAESGDTEKG